jgi:hypothetical protein
MSVTFESVLSLPLPFLLLFLFLPLRFVECWLSHAESVVLPIKGDYSVTDWVKVVPDRFVLDSKSANGEQKGEQLAIDMKCTKLVQCEDGSLNLDCSSPLSTLAFLAWAPSVHPSWCTSAWTLMMWSCMWLRAWWWWWSVVHVWACEHNCGSACEEGGPMARGWSEWNGPF